MDQFTHTILQGAVYRYDITANTIKDITPVSGGDLYFGFG